MNSSAYGFHYVFLLLVWAISLNAINVNKPTLIIFSGSDWCLPCIRLEKEVFSTIAFQNFANEHLELIRADFPQRKVLEQKIQDRNESLAEKYNPEGIFPRICLINQGEDTPLYLPSTYENPESIIRDLMRHIKAPEVFRKKALLMGTAFEFSIVHENEEHAEQILNLCVEETRKIEGVLSEWMDSSQVSHINRLAGIQEVEVDDLLYNLTKRSIEISKITQGAFDISFGGMDVWKFEGQELESWPDEQDLKARLELIDYRKVRLTAPNKIMLEQKGMKIGFGAIGKGLVADLLKEQLIEMGVTAGVINASGDLTVWGKRPDGSDWNIGISNPDIRNDLLFGLKLDGRSIATSGSYEKYFNYQGKRYSHIIDPRTGLPVYDKKSVSVISPSAELSDALATAFFVLDTEISLDIAEQIPGVSCIIIDENDEVYTSNDIALE